MKKILQLIGISILVFGCHSKNGELQKIWIGKYIVHNLNTGDESISDGPKRIIDFKKDSLVLKNLYFDTYSEKIKNAIVVGYKLEGETLSVIRGTKVDTFHCNVSTDSLALNDGNRDAPTKQVLEKLPKYNLSSKEPEFRKFLLSSSFEIFDSIRIEFKANSRIIAPDYDFNVISDHNLWKIDKYQGELFLVGDGFFGATVHIKEINSDGFKGIIYGKENKEIVFKKLPHETKFKIEDLMGEWTEYKDEKSPLPPPPPIIIKERELHLLEYLTIGDSIIMKHHEYNIDTMKWEPNREQDFILFYEPNLNRKQKHWKIISLNDKELTIERKVKRRPWTNTNDGQIERKRFVRK